MDGIHRNRITMVQPIISMQLMLRENLIGNTFWQKLEIKRKEREETRFVTRLHKIKTDVKKLQLLQSHRIARGHRRQKQKVVKQRRDMVDAHREENVRLRHKVAVGARRAHSSILQMMHGKKEGRQKWNPQQMEPEFSDLGMSLCLVQ